MDVYDISLQAIDHNLKQLAVVSQNVANINTPGYLKSVPFAHYLGAGNELASGELVTLTGGTIRETSRVLDVAVVGQGFFQLELGGELVISRGGHFYLDNEQNLRHPSGAFVLGQGGKINLSGDDITIDGQGVIKLDGVEVDRFSIVSPMASSNIRPLGNGLYQLPMAQLNVVEGPGQQRVQQKALNSANVNPSEEMVRMIEISRQLQSQQKVVNAWDQLLNVGINELGKK